MDSRFVISAAATHQFPPPKTREVAVVGRSNCGKSTLLNKILNRRDLVRVSRTPGRTQLVNFFSLDDHSLLVDLPGYGYSATGRDQRAGWADLLQKYFEMRKLSGLLFLVDLRRDLQDDDIELLTYLTARHPVTLVATKMDKLSGALAQQRLRLFRERLDSEGWSQMPIIGVSCLKNTNIDALRKHIHKQSAPLPKEHLS